jgi:hypothetical protein
MIAIEHAPVAAHWTDECARTGIVLAWPEGFDGAIA